jgi:pimeloyl-ACP methyl ester carboxylesterase
MSEGLRRHFAYSNGIRIHYVEQGEGPLVLLCHDWPKSWHSWRHQIPALAHLHLEGGPTTSMRLIGSRYAFCQARPCST